MSQFISQISWKRAALWTVALGMFALLCFTAPRVAVIVAMTLPFLAIVDTPLPTEEFQTRVLGGVEHLSTKYKEMQAKINDLAMQQLKTQKAEIGRLASIGSPGTASGAPTVSEGCARHLGALALSVRLRKGDLQGEDRERVFGMVKEALGYQERTALSESDIPLPTAYSNEVVALVSTYGTARKWGTVFPLGAGTMKLPKLKTSPAFGIIGMSSPLPEKSPQIEFAELVAKKFGGLIRLPSEIMADSIVAMGMFLADYCAREIAKIEDVAYWTADASGTYGGMAGLTKAVADTTRLETMGSTKTSVAQATLGNFRALRTKIDAAALGQGAYYLHPSMESLLFSYNTGGDKPFTVEGVNGPSLDGYPVRWIPALPVYTTAATVSTVFGIFGDTRYMYLGTRDQIRFDTSLDAAFDTDEIMFRCLERFCVSLLADGAVAGIKTAAS
jgi:HK97 family phage major capsid protein